MNQTTRSAESVMGQALGQALRAAIQDCLTEELGDGTLPRGTPLLAPTAQAAEIFGLSAATLYRLRQRYPDFRALTVKTGREVLYDVPALYAWFRQFGGAELDIAE